MHALLLSLPLLAPAPRAALPLQDDAEIEALVASERAQADLFRRRGKLRQARSLLTELLDEEENDPATRVLLARVELDRAHYERALAEARSALEQARAISEGGDGEGHLLASCVRGLGEVLLRLGLYGELEELLAPPGGAAPIDPARDPRDAWLFGRALEVSGDRDGARRVWDQGCTAPEGAGWEQLLAAGRCARALGRLEEASRLFVQADALARKGEGREPDILAALGALYFESEREVEAQGKRSAGALYRQALELHPTHEEALLGLFELHRYNRRRVSQSPEEILGVLLGAYPDSVRGLEAKVSADLSDGLLKSVRAALARLDELAPGRREVRTLHAALAWVEHRRKDCEALLEALAREAPEDATPEREVGHYLCELYRFAEALPFLERATKRDAADYLAWTDYGRALANTGREDEAREALDRADRAAAGRQDAWRNNMRLVLRRMQRRQVSESFGALTFAWRSDAAEVLRTYLVPFYSEAREELAERYGYTPGPTRIEVFRHHEDFSVRSVGFSGFPALGVCFGPVVTALSPLAELRGSFSWARTGFHEFSHVIHLGLSHNRCPRWITEGLATWEEVHRDPSWTRNMRRELLDARAQDDLIPVRELNRAFRGPRILFGYYQGGLLCKMLIEEHGFPPMIRLLEAFDRGLDLDQALAEVFQRTPEELDAAFEEWVDRFLEGLDIEPRWGRRDLARLRITLEKSPPAGEAERRAWMEDWLTLAWGSWQGGGKLDAEEALRVAQSAGLESPRALFLSGEMALAEGHGARARKAFEKGVALGGRRYRGLMALAALQVRAGELEEAARTYALAEESFPGFDDKSFNAELKLAEVYRRLERPDDAEAAVERWLRWNPGAYDERLSVAAWHVEAGRFEAAARLYGEANAIDPFRRDLHLAWAAALLELERYAEAERELRVALLVPPELDLDHLRFTGDPGSLPPGIDPEHLPPGVARGLPPDQVAGLPLSAEERARILGERARCLEALERREEAAELRRQAQELEQGD